MAINGKLAFTYPYSKLLGNRPCGKNPTPNIWVQYGADPNLPVYKNAPNESCGTETSCTPRLRFIDGNNDLAISRMILKQANNRKLYSDVNNVLVTPTNITLQQQVDGGNFQLNSGAQTPFRALMNAGDPASSVNKYPASLESWQAIGQNPDQIYVNAPNQVSSTRRASNGSAVRMSGYMPLKNASVNSAPSGGGQTALWSGNNRWVYDGTDYVRFKKLQATNRNFNDISWGGDRHNASQVAKSRVRR